MYMRACVYVCVYKYIFTTLLITCQNRGPDLRDAEGEPELRSDMYIYIYTSVCARVRVWVYKYMFLTFSSLFRIEALTVEMQKVNLSCVAICTYIYTSVCARVRVCVHISI